MEVLKLVTPDSKYEKQYMRFIKDCAEDIHKHEMSHYMPLSSAHSFFDDIRNLSYSEKGVDLPVGWVSASTFWLTTENYDRILGAISIRHKLTERLLFRGGHIAYYVHKYERQKGYASEMLRLGMEKCRELGIDKILITCAKSNIGSVKTILNNGGAFHSEDIEEGEQFQRYWIELKK